MLLAVVILTHGFCGRCADVVIDRYQTFQTIEGWGHGGGVLGGTQGAYSLLAPAVADSATSATPPHREFQTPRLWRQQAVIAPGGIRSGQVCKLRGDAAAGETG